MNCTHAKQMLDAMLDGELDASTSAELVAHLAACPECVARKAERDAVRARVRAAAPHFVASPLLRQSVLQAAQSAGYAATRVTHDVRPTWWQTFGLAASVCLVSVVLTLLVTRAPVGARTQGEQLVARHVASLARASPVDVASSDRHVIKPWFHGKIDFAPAVRDLAAQGFTLRGARLEHVDGNEAVAVVYQIRQHPINLFVWSAASVTNTAPEQAVVRGFSTIRWHADGLAYVAVSDVELGELARFAREVTVGATP